MVVITEGTSKSAKATEVLAQCKVEAAKTTLPPLVEKPSKLMKVSENLIHWKTEAAKVAAAEKEKKKIHDMPPVVNLDKKMSSKRKAPSTSEKDKGVVVEERQPKAVKPQEKKSRTDPTAETDENMDALATPQVELSSLYPPKAREPQEPKDHPVIAPIDPVEVAEI
jgi:hypothetical protein